MADATAQISDEARQAARSAGLRYTKDEKPGIRRKKAGQQFTFFSPDGTRIRDEAELSRICKLAVPPAYTDVWISTDAKGHLATRGSP